MNSYLTDDFIRCFQKLPKRIKNRARKSYKLWKENPNHPSLKYKRIHPNKLIYSVRISLGWRAIGYREKDSMIWFWIGSHENYNKLISRL